VPTQSTALYRTDAHRRAEAISAARIASEKRAVDDRIAEERRKEEERRQVDIMATAEPPDVANAFRA
jgi:hypothetical protein